MEADIIPLEFLKSSDTSYDNWKDCYEKVLKTKITDSDKGDQTWAPIKKFIESGGFEFL
jgi:hypothetical protein